MALPFQYTCGVDWPLVVQFFGTGFMATFLSALAWPVAVFGIAMLFKAEFRAILEKVIPIKLNTLKKVEGYGFNAEFEASIKQVLDEAEKKEYPNEKEVSLDKMSVRLLGLFLRLYLAYVRLCITSAKIKISNEESGTQEVKELLNLYKKYEPTHAEIIQNDLTELQALIKQ